VIAVEACLRIIIAGRLLALLAELIFRVSSSVAKSKEISAGAGSCTISDVHLALQIEAGREVSSSMTAVPLMRLKPQNMSPLAHPILSWQSARSSTQTEGLATHATLPGAQPS
jgi:hypothetical protein